MAKTSFIREALRHVVLDVGAMKLRVGGKFESIKQQNVVQCMLLHDVYPHQERKFAELLDWLHERFEFVSYSQAVAAAKSGQIKKPMMTMTFDDGMANNLQAAKIMRDRGVKACFFVCPNVVNEPSKSKLAEFCDNKLHREPCGFLSWKQLEEMKTWGHEIGSHTLNHTDLAKADDESVEVEINTSKVLIEKELGHVEHFAWPYGRWSNLTQQIASSVFAAGYTSCASGERGSHASHQESTTHRICIRRESMNLDWPLRHVKYFVAKSAMQALPPNATWPSDWQGNV